MSEKVVGFVIEGIFDPLNGDQVMFTTPMSQEVEDLLVAETAKIRSRPWEPFKVSVIQGIKPRSGSLDTSIDPFLNKIRHSSYTFRLPATDEIGSYFFRKAGRAVGETTEILPPVNIDENLQSTSGLAFTPGYDIEEGIIKDGQEVKKVYYKLDDPFTSTLYLFEGVIYIGDETLFIKHSDSEEDEYVIKRNVGKMLEAWGLRPSHNIGSKIYNEVPYWHGRRALIVTFDPITKELTVRDKVKIVGGFSQSGDEITIQMSSQLSDMRDLTINHNMPAHDLTTNTRLSSVSLSIPDHDDEKDIDFLKPPRVFLGGTIENSSNFGEDFLQEYEDQLPAKFILMSEGTVHVSTLWMPYLDFWNYKFAPETVKTVTTSLQPELDIEGRWDARKLGLISQPGSFHEVFYIGPMGCSTWAFQHLGSDSNFWGSPNGPSDFGLEFTREVCEAYKRHPLAICAALLSGRVNADELVLVDGQQWRAQYGEPRRFHILTTNFSLSLSHLFSQWSIIDIHRLIQETIHLQVDELVLGWDASPVKVLEVVYNLLDTFMFRIVKDNEGSIKFARIKLADIEEHENAPLVDVKPSELLELSDGTNMSSTVVNGTFGGSLPWEDPTPFRVDTDPDAEIGSHFNRPDTPETTINATGIKSPSNLQALMVQRGLIQNFQAPRLKCRVQDHLIEGHDYSLGAFVRIGDLPLDRKWLYNSSGVRISNEEAQEWIGQIIGRRYLPMQNMYELEIFFNQEAPVRYRAPSLIIGTATDNGSTWSITPSNSFKIGESMTRKFEVGDQIQLYKRDGELWDSSISEVTNTTGSSIEITYVFGGKTITPGLVIELAHLGTDSSPGFYNPNAVIDGVERAYSFMGDNLGRIGTDSEQGDING